MPRPIYFSQNCDFKIKLQKAEVFERGDSVKGGRSPRFHVQEPAHRRPISAKCRNHPQTGDFVDSLRAGQFAPPHIVYFGKVAEIMRYRGPTES